jgi:hypothetical protein
MRFLDALTLYGADQPQADAAEVSERFEVVSSRVALYREGALAAAIAGAPLHRQVVADLMATLVWADPLLPALRRGDLAGAMAVRAHLEPFLGRLREMSIADLVDDTKRRDGLRAVHLEVKRQVLVSIVLFLVAAALVVVGSLRSTWQTHRLLDGTPAPGSVSPSPSGSPR